MKQIPSWSTSTSRRPASPVIRIGITPTQWISTKIWIRSIQGVKGNPVFRAERYAPDFPGFEGLDLAPGQPVGQ